MSRSFIAQTLLRLTATALYASPLIVSSGASADWTDPATQRWIVIDLGVLPECSTDRTTYFGKGLNINGVVVGSTYDNGAECTNPAWVWTLCGDFDLTPETMYDLAAMVPGAILTDANKINDAGIIAGAAYNSTPALQQPLIWHLSTLSGGIATTLFIAAGTDGTGLAYDVTNDSPAVVAGTIEASSSGERGFYHVVGAAGTSRTLLNPLSGGDNRSNALAASPASSGNHFGGKSFTSGFSSGCADDVDQDGVRWTVTGSTSITPLYEETNMSLDLTQWVAEA